MKMLDEQLIDAQNQYTKITEQIPLHWNEERDRRYVSERQIQIRNELKSIAEEYGNDPIPTIEEVASRYGIGRHELDQMESAFKRRHLINERNVNYKRYREVEAALKALEEEKSPPSSFAFISRWEEDSDVRDEAQRVKKINLKNELHHRRTRLSE